MKKRTKQNFELTKAEIDLADKKAESVSNCVCFECGSLHCLPEDFRDDMSRLSFMILVLCQECQDQIFG